MTVAAGCVWTDGLTDYLPSERSRMYEVVVVGGTAVSGGVCVCVCVHGGAVVGRCVRPGA